MYVCCNECRKQMRGEAMPRMHEAACRAFANGRELPDCPFLEPAWWHGVEGVSPAPPSVGRAR